MPLHVVPADKRRANAFSTCRKLSKAKVTALEQCVVMIERNLQFAFASCWINWALHLQFGLHK